MFRVTYFKFRKTILSLINSADIDYDKCDKKMTSWQTIRGTFYKRSILSKIANNYN